MSERIKPLGEVDVEHVLSKGFSQAQLDRFKDAAAGADVYLERAYEIDWLTSFHTERNFMYMSRYSPSETTVRTHVHSFREVMSRSYRVVFDEGALPYAHRP